MSEEDATKLFFIQGSVFYSYEYNDTTYWVAGNDTDWSVELDYSEFFESFTYADGKYIAATLQVIDVEDENTPIDLTDVVVTIADGVVTSLSYDASVEYDGVPVSITFEATFSGYGEATVPADATMSYYNYADADIGDLVVVEAYVQATQSWWSNKITVYLADYNGAYFAYEMACTEEDAAKLVPGTMIRIEGVKSEWAGEVEITACTFTFVEGAGTYVAEAIDLTNLLGEKELIEYQNALGLFTDMTVKSVSYKNGTPGDDIYVTFTKDGADYNFCVEYYLNGNDADFYNTFATLNAGDVVDVEGFVYWYNGINTHITKITK